jgi:hypothetical protein
MAVTTKFYGKGLLGVFTGAIDLDTDTFKALLATNVYTPDQDAHDYRDDVTANEVTGTGYTAGGVTLAGVSVTYDAASNEVRILWNDATWSSSTITARYAIIYKSRGGAASADDLLAYIDFGQDMSSNNGAFTLDFTTSVLKATAA